MKTLIKATALAALTLCLAATAHAATGDAARGKTAFTATCGACHALDANRVGPMLGGVVGRKAGSVAGYAYSSAVKDSGKVWTEDNLNNWLQGPAKFIPGTKMAMVVGDEQKRADIIAYLKSTTAAK